MEWRSMDDSPKDGTAILLLIDGYAIEGWWNKNNWHIASLPSHGCGCCADDDPSPEGWSPLPRHPSK